MLRRRNPTAIHDAVGRFRDVANKIVAAGYPKGKISRAYPDGESIIDVAASHCFGLGVPKRDFMTYAKILIGRDPTIKEILKKIAEEVVSPTGNPAVVKSLQKAAGKQAVTLIQKSILEGDWPPNSPATIAKKGSSQPLIDTSLMRNSTTYVVRER